MLIFVYGTLKKGFCRHHYLKAYPCFGAFKTKPMYRLLDCGSYPGMVVEVERGLSIQGEVYEVDSACIEILDEVEGVSLGLYVKSQVEMLDDWELPVWGYLYNQSIKSMPDCGDNWSKSTEEGEL